MEHLQGLNSVSKQGGPWVPPGAWDTLVWPSPLWFSVNTTLEDIFWQGFQITCIYKSFLLNSSESFPLLSYIFTLFYGFRIICRFPWLGMLVTNKESCQCSLRLEFAVSVVISKTLLFCGGKGVRENLKTPQFLKSL